MPLYRYKARNLEGEAQKGVVEAPNYEAASDELRERRLIVLAITEKSSSTWAKRWEDLFNRVSVRDITFFARQFSVLIGATIPIVRSLRILTRQTNNNYFKRVIADVAAEVDGGSKLSQAMTKYPKVFDGFFIHMIRAGETTGRLDQVFEYLANQKEKDYALISKVRGAMVYPAFIITVMIVVGILMAVYVVPPISNILTESGAAIPITTRILLGVSWFLQYYWWLAIIIIVAVGTAMGFYIQTESGHYLFDRLKIKMPKLPKPFFHKTLKEERLFKLYRKAKEYDSRNDVTKKYSI
jgi:type IV pilus assembly protein PilC